MMKVGFIGLGTMGRPMAEHLIEGRARAARLEPPCRQRRLAVALGALHAQRWPSWRRAARSCAPMSPPAPTWPAWPTRCGRPGAGAIHLDFSTIAPGVAKGIAAAHAECGVDFVDAPVSGGGVGARNATLAIMWGGRDELAPRLAPIFAVLGKSAVRIGEAGAGQVAKACNQMILVNLIQACAEAAALANAAGVDFSLVREAMLGGSAGSRALDVFGGRMASRDFAAGVEARLHHKDYALLMDEATPHRRATAGGGGGMAAAQCADGAGLGQAGHGLAAARAGGGSMQGSLK
jgi:2-hydroxy-3-oxopropionate reductase